MAIEQKLMTAEELLRRSDDGLRHELVRGELLTMSPSGYEHGRVANRAGRSLGNHVDANGLGDVVVGDIGFRLSSDPDTVRAPDVAFLSSERLRELGRPRGFWPGAPDAVIEVISPTDLYTEVDEKVAEWLAHGTRLVLVANPRRRTVVVHRPDQSARVLSGDDALDGEDVIPGWSMRVGDLFE